ncbi:uncharacterized protein [Diadema setosum]|uniref:uncharacterized protein n=1 Tax=Diadema setosum TaxID=31175 RepID=UPI003B3AF9AE
MASLIHPASPRKVRSFTGCSTTRHHNVRQRMEISRGIPQVLEADPASRPDVEEKEEEGDREVLYKKACVYLRSRPKRVMFSVNHKLYQTGNLEDDLKRLKNDRYKGVAPPASLVWGERFDMDDLQSSKTLNEENFWPFVHSVAWRKFSSIRVTEGALLDSLLFAYYSLLTERKVFSFVTDVYRRNVATTPSTRPKNADDKDGAETVKITFTYYAASLQELSDVIYRHHGSNVGINTLAEKNESYLKLTGESPDTPLDFGWTPDQRQTALGDSSRMTRATPATPVNPPNSPTPSLVPTQTMLKRRKELSLQGSPRNVAPKYPSSYYSLPLVLRNRFTLGIKSYDDDEMTVEGKCLQRRRASTQCMPCSAVYFTRDSSKSSGYKSSLQVVRASLGTRSQPLCLPSITPTARKDELMSALDKRGDSPSPLRSCLASPNNGNANPNHRNHATKEKDKRSQDAEKTDLQRGDSKRQLTFSPNLEYINVVQRVAPCLSQPRSTAGNAKFDTKKLFINWSLEKVRQVRRRKKKKRKQKEPTPKEIMRKLDMQGTDKDYVLGKFLADQPTCSSTTTTTGSSASQSVCPLHGTKSAQCEQCLQLVTRATSPLPFVTKHSEVRRLRFADVVEDTPSPSQEATPKFPAGFADTVSSFRHQCQMSTREFIIRKEQITTFGGYKTITSITINKIPAGGFMKWQYKTDEFTLEK